MYYENFWTSFFAPSYSEEMGFSWAVGCLPDIPIFAFAVADLGGFVVPAFREPEKYTGVKVKTVVDYMSLRDIFNQFSEVTGEKASLALELTEEQFEASRFAEHPAAELMYLPWKFVGRAGPDSGYRDKSQSFSINPAAKSYREWLKNNVLVKELVQKLKTKDESVQDLEATS